MKKGVLITGLLVLLLANFIMLYVAPYGISPMEGFQAVNMAPTPAVNMAPAPATNMPVVAEAFQGGMPGVAGAEDNQKKKEGFSSYFLENAGGAKETYSPMGAYDGVKLSTGNNVSGWRYTAPNEPLMGAEFQPGPDSLFIFKNNQCKPECCGSSFSCGGGCVCTSPQQRQYIAGRGGNRTSPEDSA